ncbi:MAG: hypothetical protein Q7T46_11465 [Polaromonas sp.]|nr:hypothetical protein [Polaromonas sp.]
MMEEPAIPMNDGESGEDTPDRDWLGIAKDAFTSSTSYMDANWRKSWEDNIAMFQSRHPAGSKYNSDAYKHRSRLFRPKTRSLVRKNEAAVAAAFFSNPDVVSIEPENEADQQQVAAAELMQALMNYRLQKTIPWFRIMIGAIQTSQVVGIVCSYQYWHYKEKTEAVDTPYLDDMGQPVMGETGPVMIREQRPKVIKDEPCISLLPPENFRFDPGADWLDVVGTSPYFIRMVPMYVTDVRDMMEADDSKTGQPKWKSYSEAEIMTAMTDYDSLRQARENKREDPLADKQSTLTEFDIVWCHENFVRFGSEEMVYWTLGTEKMLTDPTPLEQVYFTAERPFVIGTCVLEANKAVPDSLVHMGAQLQRETNDTVNQRRDNVSLVLNKRFFVKRGKNVDIGSLTRNVAGGVTMMDDLADVVVQEMNDVTGSSYQEQDRLNVDYDELTGNFSSSSVMTNRKLNETVGGMNLLSGGANQLTEYLIRTLVETWVEPVLRQVVKLEQAYETDLTLLGLAGEKAQLAQKYGINQVTDELLNNELTVRVNVGMGATDPQTKLQKFVMAMKTYADIMQTMPDVEPEQVRKELFGLAGYKNGVRFFKDGQQGGEQDSRAKMELEQMQQAMQGMAKEIEGRDRKIAQLEDSKEVDLRDLMVKAYGEETKRLQAMGTALTPEAINALVMQTLQSALATPDPGPLIYEDAMGPEMMPPDQMMQPEQNPQPAGFFTPEAG